MGAAQSDFQKHFSGLSDIALLEIKRDELVDAAKTLYDEEMSRRGLAVEGESPEAELSSGEQLVNVVEFESAEDAAHAQEQLKKNGIPAYIAVAVPEAFARQAIRLLDPGVSDEELAALAESTEPLEMEE
jgi:predicted kinase